jgi:hypothetical protein
MNLCARTELVVSRVIYLEVAVKFESDPRTW